MQSSCCLPLKVFQDLAMAVFDGAYLLNKRVTTPPQKRKTFLDYKAGKRFMKLLKRFTYKSKGQLEVFSRQ